jgi:hypothetical protein
MSLSVSLIHGTRYSTPIGTMTRKSMSRMSRHIMSHRIRRLMPTTTRCYTAQHSLSFIPHEFSHQEACKRFIDQDKKRLFAPFHANTLQLVNLPDPKDNPLKKVLLPFFGVNAEISQTDYSASYGITKVIIHTNSRGQTITRTYTDWHDISGSIGPHKYTQEDPKMCIYGGLTWDSRGIEQAMENCEISSPLKPFDSKFVNPDTTVDPFLKRSAFTRKIANERIRDAEYNRIERAIKEFIPCDLVKVSKANINVKTFKMSNYLLPAYILQYPGHSPRIMPALNNKVVIIGSNPLSMAKCSGAVAVAATALSLFFPEWAFSTKLSMILISSLLSALWARYRLTIEHTWQQSTVESDRKRNAFVSETITDKTRLQATKYSLEGNPKEE